MKDQRIVEIWTTEGWSEVAMANLKTGDRFRMFEPNGEQVVNREDESTEWVVSRPAYVGDYGVYEVEIYGYDKRRKKSAEKDRGKSTREIKNPDLWGNESLK